MHGIDADTDSFRKNIQEQYDIEEELGSGQFAVVRKIVEKETGDEFAGKYVRKKRTKASRNGMSREDIKREITILRSVDHEKIIKVHDVYETDREIILVMELLRGGELFDYISKKDFLTEEEAIDFTRQILQGLQHLHSRSIVHLDLKPENILLKNTRRKIIKLVDFGLARVVNENEQVREIMGTPEFVAPEVLNFDTISTATDMWALGVIAYILLSGASPFLGEDNQETFTNIIQVDYQFDEEYFDEISDEAKDFIRKLLVKDPRKRPTAHDCSRHTWVEEEVVDKKKRQRRRTTQICTFNFKRFVARKRWKMSFNKIRAMNLIAKMGVKPPPGFITEIPPMPMVENDVNIENNVEEKSSHKEQKKNSSTINRKKHKHSSPKSNVEKTDSFTLQSMDIDIGEGEAARSGAEVATSDNEDVAVAVAEAEAEAEAAATPVETEPVDYAAMSMREKRRARGQLRHHDIVKSKKEIDAKKSHTEDQSDMVENSGDTSSETQVEEQKVKEEVKPEPETVTSTVNIHHKSVAKSTSGGILKKREAKPARIPSTEDNYLVTLDAALFQQKESLLREHNSHKPSPQHGILKHNQAKASKDKPMEFWEIQKDDGKLEGLGDGAEPGFNEEVEVGGGTPPVTSDVSQNSDTGKTDEVFEKEPKVIEEKISEPGIPSTADLNGSNVISQDTVGKNASHERIGNKNAALISQPKKPQQKIDSAQQERFSPPPWKTRKSNENLKPALKPVQGVSKSLKVNRFLSNDKQSSPKSPTGNTGLKASGVLGKSKLFQKENVPEKGSQNHAKTVASKTNSAGEELKAVACDINLEEPVKSEEVPESKNNGGKASKKKDLKENDSRESKTNHVAMSKPRSDSHSKFRSGSMKNNTNGENKTGNVVTINRSRSNSKQSTKEVVAKHNSIDSSGSNSESITVAGKIPATNEKKAIVNGENTISDEKHSKSKDLDVGEEVVSESAVQISVDKVEDETKEELTSTSTHSLTKFSIRPRQNSGDKKTGGFDVMLTIGPPKQPQEPSMSSIKSKFSSSSSSSLSEKNRVPNGNVLMSSSAIDVTNHTRETTQLTFPTGERHAPAQGPKYTPQRDFSKYLVSDQFVKKPTQTSGTPLNPKTVPSNRQAQIITVKRSTPSISPATKGQKQTVSTMYVPRKSFGFPPKHTTNQTEFITKLVLDAADDAPKTTNNNDESKRWSHSSNASDRSASSVSSEESAVFSVKLENSVNAGSTIGSLNNAEKIAGYANSTNSDQKIENHASLSPRASPVLDRKWKATLVLAKDSEKPSQQLAKDRDVRIASSNAPRKNKFTNVRSMWEGK